MLKILANLATIADIVSIVSYHIFI